MRLKRLNDLAQRIELSGSAADPPAVRKRGAIISIHGINTLGHWQDDLATWVQDAGFMYSRVTYGYVLLRSVLPWKLTSVVTRIEQRYNELRRRDLEVSVVAHSYGTLAIGNFLWRKPSAKLHRLILYGATLSRKFPWVECHRRQQFTNVLNEVGLRDPWPWLGPAFFLLHPQVGWAGVRGFEKPPPCVSQCFYSGSGHSDLQSEEHFRRVWIPFISEGPEAISDLIRATGKRS